MPIPAKNKLGHTIRASPMQLNTKPANILLENVYLEKKKMYNLIFNIQICIVYKR